MRILCKRPRSLHFRGRNYSFKQRLALRLPQRVGDAPRLRLASLTHFWPMRNNLRFLHGTATYVGYVGTGWLSHYRSSHWTASKYIFHKSHDYHMSSHTHLLCARTTWALQESYSSRRCQALGYQCLLPGNKVRSSHG